MNEWQVEFRTEPFPGYEVKEPMGWHPVPWGVGLALEEAINCLRIEREKMINPLKKIINWRLFNVYTHEEIDGLLLCE